MEPSNAVAKQGDPRRRWSGRRKSTDASAFLPEFNFAEIEDDKGGQ
jgi:hypothetical protein